MLFLAPILKCCHKFRDHFYIFQFTEDYHVHGESASQHSCCHHDEFAIWYFRKTWYPHVKRREYIPSNFQYISYIVDELFNFQADQKA